jgi:hypothetical protein
VIVVQLLIAPRIISAVVGYTQLLVIFALFIQLLVIMKFRDGMWLVAEGVHPEYAEEVYSITQGEKGKALSLLCPTKKQPQRFDSLNMPTLTIVWQFLIICLCDTDFTRTSELHLTA